MSTKTFPTLFKHTAKEGTQVWEIRVEPIPGRGGVDCGRMVTTYGLVDGKKQMISEVISEGKNVGKKNATTPYQQACAEAESRWNKQKDRKGYGLTVEESKAVRSVSPMLAHPYDKHKDKVEWDNAFAQRKLDGFRCLARLGPDGRVLLTSRENQPLEGVLEHIADGLRPLLVSADRLVPGFTFDGELYLHGLSLNTISSACKAKGELTPRIEYHVYDAPMAGAFRERVKLLDATVRSLPLPFLKLVETFQVASEFELMTMQKEFIGEGYEGAMLRFGAAGYEAGKRSSTLLKVKTFKAGEFKVVGYRLGRGKMGNVPIFLCDHKGNTFEVTAPGTMEEKAALGAAAEQCVGRALTVKYQYLTKTDAPVPFLPVALQFRETKGKKAAVLSEE